MIRFQRIAAFAGLSVGAVGVLYHVGDIVLYLGAEYRCPQQHTSIQTWNPVATLNVLWQLVK